MTKNIAEINEYLSERDNILSSIIKEFPINEIEYEDDYYFSLIESIVSQQLSLKAANTIFNRFLDLFDSKYPIAEKLIKIDISELRAVGLSNQKANYVKNVADFSLNNNFKDLVNLSDEEIIIKLTSIKGVGRWTSEMLLIFSMGRLDILPIDDLVVKKSIQNLYQLKEEGKALNIEIFELSKNWQPYRSIASRYFWKWNDNVNRKK